MVVAGDLAVAGDLGVAAQVRAVEDLGRVDDVRLAVVAREVVDIRIADVTHDLSVVVDAAYLFCQYKHRLKSYPGRFQSAKFGDTLVTHGVDVAATPALGALVRSLMTLALP